jgi:tetraacyldisaccharide 4'-kinase
LFKSVSALRQQSFQRGWSTSYRAPVPVIVVGNIAVGGTGKTPLTIGLLKQLQSRGYSVGVVSRGYGSQAKQFPFFVTAETPANLSGDEPKLIARATGCPLVIDPDRPAAIRALLQQHSVDLIISDDGLQHYAMARDIEIAVIDGQRLFGNGFCLPAGPLREPISRLESVDFIVVNGGASDSLAGKTAHTMTLKAGELMRLSDSVSVAAGDWPYSRQVHAVAGIGNPTRFFQTLRGLGFDPIEHAFADHHPYTADDLAFDDDLPIVMTEKDAVKVAPLVLERCWSLPVEAELPEVFIAALIHKIEEIQR